MKKMEVVVKGEVSMLERRDLTKKGAYFTSYFVESLRGGKRFMMDAEGLRHHIGKLKEGPLSHVAIPRMVGSRGKLGVYIAYRPLSTIKIQS